jgi:hypothetical protein
MRTTNAMLAVLLGLATVLCIATPTGAQTTVLSVSGETEWRADDAAPWQPLLPGTVLPKQARVRTGPGGTVRLVRADGRLSAVGPGQAGPLKRLLAGGAAPPTRQGGVLAVLRELFAGATPSRMAAAESYGPGASSGPVGASGRQGTWLAMVGGPKLTAKQALDAVALAAAIGESAHRNRALALLSKAATDRPELPGLAALAMRARAELAEAGALALYRHDGRDRTVLADGDTVRTGQRLRAEYRAEVESFPVLFLRSLPDRGTPRTVRLHPAADGIPVPLPAGTVLRLPGAETIYRLDAAVGHEHVFGWACAASPDTAALREAVRRVEAAAVETGMPRLERVAGATPIPCFQAFTLTLRHAP